MDFHIPFVLITSVRRFQLDNVFIKNRGILQSRGVHTHYQTSVKIIGLIDNMSFFKGDDGKEYKIFGESGVEKTAKQFNKEFLGHLPIHQDLRNSADKGDPLTHADPDHEVSKLFNNIAEKIRRSFL